MTDHRPHEKSYAEIGALFSKLEAENERLRADVARLSTVPDLIDRHLDIIEADRRADRWRTIADTLADALRTYEAVDGAGIGAQALAEYEEALR